MVTQIGKHTIEYYDSIDEMPIVRYQRYQKLLLIDAGIGGDIASFDQRLTKLSGYIAADDKDSARKEITNLRQAVFFVQQEYSPKYKAFAALVKKIDGKEYDFSEAAIDEITKIVAEGTVGEVTATVGAVKKKIDEELTAYFPRLFGDSQVKEYYTLLKQRTMAILENIGKGADEIEDENVKRLTLKLMTFSKPTDWSAGAEVEIDRQFEDICLAISEQLHANAKQYTVLEFYNAYDFLAERAREAKKRAK